MREVDWDSIKEGDSVRLKFTGNPRVPMWLNHSWAKVLKRNKVGNLVVQALNESDGFTRTLQPRDIVNHKPIVLINGGIYYEACRIQG